MPDDLKRLMDTALAGIRPSPGLASDAIRRYLRRQRGRRVGGGVLTAAALLVGVVLLFTAGNSSRSGDSRLVPVSGTAAPSGPTRYVATSSVIADSKYRQGTQLCVGGVAQSLPPSCGGVRLIGVDINKLPGVRTYNGVTWTETPIRVIGTYRNGALTVTESPRIATSTNTQGFFSVPAAKDLPCSPPAGGWTSRKFTPADAAVLAAYGAAHQDTFGGLWTDHHQRVGVVSTTGDIVAARQEIRRTYAGNLCVTKADHTDRVLRAAEATISTAMTPPSRLGIVTASLNTYESRIDIEVTVEDAAVTHYLATHFPPGLVRVSAFLVPMK